MKTVYSHVTPGLSQDDRGPRERPGEHSRLLLPGSGKTLHFVTQMETQAQTDSSPPDN